MNTWLIRCFAGLLLVLPFDPGAFAQEPDQGKKPGAVFKVPGSHTLDVALSPDGKILARAGVDQVDLWDVASGKKLHTLKGYTAPLFKVAFSPDGKTLASIAGGWGPDDCPGEVKLWDVATGKERVPVEGHRSRVWFMAFSADGKTLATSSDGPAAVKLWDVATGKEKMELGVSGPLAFAPDGKTLAMCVGGGDTASVQLWDLTTGKKRASMPGHVVYSLAFTPDGKTLVSAGYAKEQGEMVRRQLKLWDIATAKERATIAIPGFFPAQFFPLVFTADSRTLITAGVIGKNNKGEITTRRSVQHWDLATGKARATFWVPSFNAGGENAGIYFAALSADGKTLAWGGAEKKDKKSIGTAHVWEVQSLATSVPELPKKFQEPAPKKPLDAQADRKPVDAPKENAAKKEMEKLQGTWQLVEAEIFGQGRGL